MRISGCPTRIGEPGWTLSDKVKPLGANTMIVDPCWNHPISSPLVSDTSKGIVRRPSRRKSVRASRKSEADACHQDRRDRNQCDGMSGAGEPDPYRGSLILAEQALDALESDRIDIPCIAGNVVDGFHTAVMRSVEPVIHGRRLAAASRSSHSGRPRHVRRHRAGRATDRGSPLSAKPHLPPPNPMLRQSHRKG